MKLSIQINPDHYPLIIITAFVIGVIIAMALGFTPGYGSHGGGSRHGGQGYQPPALVYTVPDWSLFE